MNIQIPLSCDKALCKYLYKIYVSCIKSLFQTLPNIYAKINIWQNSKCTCVYGKERTFSKLKNENYSSVKKKLNYWYRIKELFPYYQFAYVNDINLPLSNHAIFKGDDQALDKFSKTTGLTCLLEKPDYLCSI